MLFKSIISAPVLAGLLFASTPATAASSVWKCEIADLKSALEGIERVNAQNRLIHERRLTHFRNANFTIEEISWLYGEAKISESETEKDVLEYSWITPWWNKKSSTGKKYDLKDQNNCIKVYQAVVTGILVLRVGPDGQIINKIAVSEISR